MEIEIDYPTGSSSSGDILFRDTGSLGTEAAYMLPLNDRLSCMYA